MTAAIVIDDPVNPPVIGSVDRDNTFIAQVFALSNNNNTGVLGWQWTLLDKPAGSAASLATPTSATSQITPDVPGSYLIELRTYTDAGMTILDDVDIQEIGVRYANQAGSVTGMDWRIPAAGETTQQSASRGWAAEVNAILADIRTEIATIVGGSFSETLQEAYENGNSVSVTAAQGTVQWLSVENQTVMHLRNTFVGGSGSAMIVLVEMGNFYTGYGVRIEQGSNGGTPFIVRTSAPADGFVIGPLGHAYSAGSFEASPTWSSPADQDTGVILPGGDIYAIGCFQKEQVRFAPSGIVTYGSTATAAVAITPTHDVIGGDGVAPANDDLVRFRHLYDPLNEYRVFSTARNRNGGGYVEIGTVLHLGTPGLATGTVAQRILFNGAGGGAQQTIIEQNSAAPAQLDIRSPDQTHVHIAGTNIASFTNLQMLLKAHGTAATPALRVSGASEQHGLYRVSATALGLTSSGVERGVFADTGVTLMGGGGTRRVDVGPAGSVAAVDASAFFNAGTGGVARQSEIRGDTGGYLRCLSPVAFDVVVASVIRMEFDSNTTMCPAGTRAVHIGRTTSAVDTNADLILNSGNGTTPRATGLRGTTTGNVQLTAEVTGQLRIGPHPGSSTIVEWSSTNLVNLLSGSENGPVTCPAGNDPLSGFSQLDGAGTLAWIANQSARIKISGTTATTRMGTGSGYADIIGRAHVNVTSVGNVTTGEDDLMTYTLPGNSLSVNGRGVRITAWFKTAANANSKTIKLYFGATEIARVSKSLNDKRVKITAEVLRTGAATQLSWSETIDGTNAAASDSTALEDDGPAETLSGNITIKATGEATATDDILQTMMVVEYFG